MHPYAYLAMAIVFEVSGTSLLKAAEGFTRLWPSLGVVASYGFSFYFLSQALASIPTGVAYAIWSGVGIVLVAGAGWFFFKQTLDAGALVGMGLILAGVVVIQLFSRSLAH